MTAFSRKHNAKVAQIIKEEHLIEMTPEEVDAHRKMAWAKIRAKLAERGYTVRDDEALLRLLKLAKSEEDPQP